VGRHQHDLAATHVHLFHLDPGAEKEPTPGEQDHDQQAGQHNHTLALEQGVQHGPNAG